jgi:hypothetical protein
VKYDYSTIDQLANEGHKPQKASPMLAFFFFDDDVIRVRICNPVPTSVQEVSWELIEASHISRLIIRAKYGLPTIQVAIHAYAIRG